MTAIICAHFGRNSGCAWAYAVNASAPMSSTARLTARMMQDFALCRTRWSAEFCARLLPSKALPPMLLLRSWCYVIYRPLAYINAAIVPDVSPNVSAFSVSAALFEVYARRFPVEWLRASVARL